MRISASPIVTQNAAYGFFASTAGADETIIRPIVQKLEVYELCRNIGHRKQNRKSGSYFQLTFHPDVAPRKKEGRP